MIAIIDYGMGNVASVQKALNFLKLDSIITADHDQIAGASHIVLPGVGSFLQGMTNLRENGLDQLLTDQVISKKKKFLGICLGMQLIFETSTEPVLNEGLGWVPGTVNKFPAGRLRVPHMGWNNIDIKKDTYYSEVGDKKDFYFIHSYHVLPENPDVIAATADYGFDVVASIQVENIFATQFHPEKSQSAGLSVLKSFFTYA